MIASLLPGLVLALALIACNRSEETAAPKPQPQPPSSSGNPLTAPVDYLGAVAKAKKVSEKTINLVSLNNAIQLFNAQEERLPKSIDELVAKHYLAAVPAVPVGMRIAYNPQTGDVKIVPQQ